MVRPSPTCRAAASPYSRLYREENCLVTRTVESAVRDSGGGRGGVHEGEVAFFFQEIVAQRA